MSTQLDFEEGMKCKSIVVEYCTVATSLANALRLRRLLKSGISLRPT
jgi:hypothetical protein